MGLWNHCPVCSGNRVQFGVETHSEGMKVGWLAAALARLEPQGVGVFASPSQPPPQMGEETRRAIALHWWISSRPPPHVGEETPSRDWVSFPAHGAYVMLCI